MTHIYVSKLTIIGSDNDLSPDRRQAIFWTNTGLLLIGPLGTNFREILIEILTFSFKKMRLKVSSAKRRPFCLALNVLKDVDFFKAVTEISWNLMTLWLTGSQLLFSAVTTPFCIIFSICINTCLLCLLICSIFRWKNYTSTSERVQFFWRKIERINRPIRIVLL